MNKILNNPTLRNSNIVFKEDRTEQEKKWNSLKAPDSFALDFIGSSALLEWLFEQAAISMNDSQEGRYGYYRNISKFVDISPIIGQLVLFEKTYLNIGMFYSSNLDLTFLSQYDFLETFPRPDQATFFDSYKLLLPTARRAIAEMLRKLIRVPFDQIWESNSKEISTRIGDFENLSAVFYLEYAKHECGLQSNDSLLRPYIKDEIFFKIVDLVEYATCAQGHMGASNMSFFSSLLKGDSNSNLSVDKTTRQQQNENLFALYRLAANKTLGFAPNISSFHDILRLRDDKRIDKIRLLLSEYRHVIGSDDRKVISEIENAMSTSKKEMSKLSFSENPVYIFIIKALSYAPVLGTCVNIINDSIDLYKFFQEQKHGWIYWGVE